MTGRSDNQVTLLDGTVVSSASEAWRHECEARAILAMPSLGARREHLYGKIDQWGKPRGGIQGRRGPEAVKRLEATMLQIWNLSKHAA